MSRHPHRLQEGALLSSHLHLEALQLRLGDDLVLVMALFGAVLSASDSNAFWSHQFFKPLIGLIPPLPRTKRMLQCHRISCQTNVH